MRDYHPVRQTTSLKSHVHESSLEWEIDHFMEYSDCNIEEIQSEVIEMQNFDANWQLTVYPKTSSTGNVALRFKVLKLNSTLQTLKTLVKFEVRAEVTGNEMNSPANRHMVRSRGMHAEVVHEIPAKWTIDYTPVTDHQEFFCENFIKHDHLTYFLGGNILALKVDAMIKTVEVVNSLKN